MRDDLHHSLPQTSPWRKVVRLACAPGGGDVVDALTRATWATEATWRNEPWGKQFLGVLAAAQGDLFGSERIEHELLSLESSCPSFHARRALDIAFAQVASGSPLVELKERVTQAVLEVSAEDGIEGAVAWVARNHPETQARQLRSELLGALTKCDFRQPPAPKQRRPKPTVEEGLAISLALRVSHAASDSSCG